jgi:hypothetical protein
LQYRLCKLYQPIFKTRKRRVSQILPSAALPAAGIQKVSDKPGALADGAGAAPAGFAATLDSAHGSTDKGLDQSAEKAPLIGVDGRSKQQAAPGLTAIGGEDLPLAGNIRPPGTELPAAGADGVSLTGKSQTLAVDPTLPVVAFEAQDTDPVQTLAALPPPASAMELDPGHPPGAAMAVVEFSLMAPPRARMTSDTGAVAGDGELSDPNPLTGGVLLDRRQLELQQRPPGVSASLADSQRSVTEPLVTRELPVNRDAVIQTEKSAFAAGIETALQSAAAEGGSSSQNQAPVAAGLSGAVRQASLADTMPQELKPALSSQHMQAPVGSDDWGQEFAVRMRWMLNGNSQQATLKLNPAELGSIEVKIATEGDQTRLLFVVQHASAREAIEGSMPRLREVLEQNGMSVSSSEVKDQSQSRAGQDGARGHERGSYAGAGAGSEQVLEADIGSEHETILDGRSTLINYYI